MNLKFLLTTSCWIACMSAGSVIAGETTSKITGSKPIPKELAGLRDRWTSVLDEFLVPGLAVVVVKDDQVIYLDTFGHRNLEKRLPVTPDTQFYIASCTKPFTAMGIMTLVDQGRIKLDDPVKKYLPRLELPDASLTAKLTIRDLLCHAHGISSGPIVLLDAYTGEITEDRFYHFLKENGEIKGKPDYTNVHYTLAGRVIEAVTGKSWRDYLDEAVFTPAGMTSATGYADRMYASDDVATPYDVGAEGLEPATHRKVDATMHAAGGLGISISDMARWLRLCMNNGEIDGKRIINSTSAAEMIRLHTEAPRGNIRVTKGFGLAWFVGTFQPDGPAYVSHGGGYIGAGAHMSFLPEEKIGVAILTNAGQPAAIFADNIVSVDIYDKLLGAKVPDLLPGLRGELSRRLPRIKERAAKMAADIEAANVKDLALPAKKYCGTYVNKWFGTIRVSQRDGRLGMRMGGMEMDATKYKANEFTLVASEGDRLGDFNVEDGQVRGVTLSLDAGKIRFDRE